MTPRTRPGDVATQRARLAIAEEFSSAARASGADHGNVGDTGHAVVTLLVLAGIAAADAICCARLREYSIDEKHAAAESLLERADRGSGRHLHVLLGMKSRASYSVDRITADDVKRAQRAADALLVRARQLR